MALRNSIVLRSENFERNLREIERFQTQAGEPKAYVKLLDELLDDVIPTLEAFPEIGRLFSERPAMSVKGRTAEARLKQKLRQVFNGAPVREYVLKDYLVLYANLPGKVYLFAIRHHSMRSYDLHLAR